MSALSDEQYKAIGEALYKGMDMTQWENGEHPILATVEAIAADAARAAERALVERIEALHPLMTYSDHGAIKEKCRRCVGPGYPCATVAALPAVRPDTKGAEGCRCVEFVQRYASGEDKVMQDCPAHPYLHRESKDD